MKEKEGGFDNRITKRSKFTKRRSINRCKKGKLLLFTVHHTRKMEEFRRKKAGKGGRLCGEAQHTIAKSEDKTSSFTLTLFAVKLAETRRH